jgi:hypothetical protein
LILPKLDMSWTQLSKTSNEFLVVISRKLDRYGIPSSFRSVIHKTMQMHPKEIANIWYLDRYPIRNTSYFVLSTAGITHISHTII